MMAAPRCPRCGSIDATPIVYGLVTMPGRDTQGRPEYIAGGCTIRPGLPTRECQRCAARYGRIEDELDDEDEDEDVDEDGEVTDQS